MRATTLLSAASLVIVTQALPTIPFFSWFPHQSSPTMPTSTLPAATGTLKYVALGLGTQNYTCSSPSAVPVAAGALANLYDATAIMSSDGFIGQTATRNMPCFADRSDNAFGLRQIGVHYFNGAGVPNFDLTMAGQGEYLEAAKMATAVAPSDSCTGRDGGAAVAWLYLAQDGSGVSRGLSSVYRVATAGGTAVSCAGVENGWVTSDYAATYWFYSDGSD